MTETVNIYDAKTHLSGLVDRAAAGEEIIIAKAGRPMARLVPLTQPVAEERKPAGVLRTVWMAEDFDAPLPLSAFGIDEE